MYLLLNDSNNIDDNMYEKIIDNNIQLDTLNNKNDTFCK